jgi:hypothetical protein
LDVNTGRARCPNHFARPVARKAPGGYMNPPLVLTHRRAVLALIRDLDPRDRWGYKLHPNRLAEIVERVVQNQDHDIEFQIEDLAIAMLTGEVPMICPDHDTPPEDDLLAQIIATIITNKEKQ